MSLWRVPTVLLGVARSPAKEPLRAAIVVNGRRSLQHGFNGRIVKRKKLHGARLHLSQIPVRHLPIWTVVAALLLARSTSNSYTHI